MEGELAQLRTKLTATARSDTLDAPSPDTEAPTTPDSNEEKQPQGSEDAAAQTPSTDVATDDGGKAHADETPDAVLGAPEGTAEPDEAAGKEKVSDKARAGKVGLTAGRTHAHPRRGLILQVAWHVVWCVSSLRKTSASSRTNCQTERQVMMSAWSLRQRPI